MLNQGKKDCRTILYKKNLVYSLKKRESLTRIIKSKDWLSVNKSCQVHFSVLFLWGNLDRVTKESEKYIHLSKGNSQ